MVTTNIATELIRRNGDFKYNSDDASYARIFETEEGVKIQVRVSTHGTDLITWNDKPSETVNIHIAFTEDGSRTNTTSVATSEVFEVNQYVYDCRQLDAADLAMINRAVLSISDNNGFVDPLKGSEKRAKTATLKPKIVKSI